MQNCLCSKILRSKIDKLFKEPKVVQFAKPTGNLGENMGNNGENMNKTWEIIGEPIGEIRETSSSSQKHLKQTLLGDATHTTAKYSLHSE